MKVGLALSAPPVSRDHNVADWKTFLLSMDKSRL